MSIYKERNWNDPADYNEVSCNLCGTIFIEGDEGTHSDRTNNTDYCTNECRGLDNPLEEIEI